MSEPAIRLLVGTTKGAFVLDGDPDRTTWTVRETLRKVYITG